MTGGPVDDYLDQLFVQLRSHAPRDARSMLSETEDHLRDAAHEARLRGLSDADAEAEAVRRFGDARLLAVADRRRGRVWVARATLVSAWSLGAWGAVAVGSSGLLAGVLRLAGGTAGFLAGPWPRGGAGAAACARWLSLSPHATSCAEAAIADWANEVVAYRVAFGLLGVLALAALAVARRSLVHGPRWSPLPSLVTDTIGTAMFGASGAVLAGLGIDALAVSSGSGVGQWLSAAVVALAAAGVFGLRLLRGLRAAG